MFYKSAQNLLCYNNPTLQTGGGYTSSFYGLYVFLITLALFLIKVLLVMISYNLVVPRLLASYSFDMRQYRPISFVESIFLVILFNNLFSRF